MVGRDNDQSWDYRGHFFAAAAEAMRRILVEAARRKQGPGAGGNHSRIDLDEEAFGVPNDVGTVIASDRRGSESDVRMWIHASDDESVTVYRKGSKASWTRATKQVPIPCMIGLARLSSRLFVVS